MPAVSTVVLGHAAELDQRHASWAPHAPPQQRASLSPISAIAQGHAANSVVRAVLSTSAAVLCVFF